MWNKNQVCCIYLWKLIVIFINFWNTPTCLIFSRGKILLLMEVRWSAAFWSFWKENKINKNYLSKKLQIRFILYPSFTVKSSRERISTFLNSQLQRRRKRKGGILGRCKEKVQHLLTHWAFSKIFCRFGGCRRRRTETQRRRGWYQRCRGRWRF